jgi:hypothetical protein
MSDNNQIHNQDDIIVSRSEENFCGACAVIPIAIAGLGVSKYGAKSSSSKNKLFKKISLWGGIVSIVVSLIVAVYYINNCSECE